MTSEPGPSSDNLSAQSDLPLRSRMSTPMIALQVVGGLVGIALLIWCVTLLLTPKNRDAISHLSNAPKELVLALLGLSLIVVLVGGETFRQVLMPVQRLPLARMHATNAIAGLLALVPFKLSIVFRVLVHNRRDGVNLLTIGAWFTGVSLVILSVLAPVILASWWRGRADAWWLGASLLGILLSASTMLALARWISSERGWAFAKRVWIALPLPRVIKHSTLLDRVHEGLRMLSHPRTLATCVLLRATDLACQAGRVYIAARLVGLDIPMDQAALAGSVYFLVGAISPAGQAGTREGVTAAIVAALLPAMTIETLALIVLPISASELLVLLTLSIIGMPLVRPDKLLLKRVGTQPSPRNPL